MDDVTRARRYLRRLPLFSPFRNRYRWTLAVLFLFCITFILFTHISKPDTTITIAHFDTRIYNERSLESDELIDVKRKGDMDSAHPNPRKGRASRFSYTQAKGYNNSLFDCGRLRKVKIKSLIASGLNSIMYAARIESDSGSDWRSIRIVSKKCPSISTCLKQDTKKEVLVDCDTLSDEILSHEATLLHTLRHPSVAPLLNLCRRVDGGAGAGTKSRVGAQLMILEDARQLNMSQLLRSSWIERVKSCLDVASLIEYLYTNKSFQLIPFEERQFYVSSKDDVIKLVDVGGLVRNEPKCSSNEDCYIINAVVAECINGTCQEYNWKANSMNAHRKFYSILLTKQPPPILLPHVMSLLGIIQKSRLTPPSIRQKLFKLYNVSKYLESYQDFRITDDLDLDLDQATSSDFGKIKKKADYVYDEIPDAEISDTHNYHCPSTIKPDRCVYPVDSPSHAQDLCSSDDICQSVSIAPNPASQSGWFLASLKRSASNLLYRPGSRLFLKRALEKPQQVKSRQESDFGSSNEKKSEDSKEEEQKPEEKLETVEPIVGKPVATSSLEAMQKDECYADIFKEYTELFQKKESHLMKICGWSSASDANWVEDMQTLSLRSEGLMKSSKTNPGGGIKVNLGSDRNKKAWMKIKPDMTAQQRHISQLAFFLLDRLLGLYVTVPTTGRRLLVSEVTDSDITIALSKMQISPDEDSSFKCTLSAWASSVQGIAGQRWSLTPQREIAWAVSRFSNNQKNQLAFLLANWLGLMPFKPQNAVQVQQGYNIHIDNDAAFTVVPNDIFLYFNNCQFPKHVIEILLKLKEKSECSIASILYRALNADPLNITLSDSKHNSFSLKIVDQMARILLQTADQCIRRFGQDNVFYDDIW